jgi:hypothetical protein
MLSDMRALVVLMMLGLSSTSWAEGGRSAFTASAGVGFLNRSFTWDGRGGATLTPSSQPFAGVVAVDSAWFPGAHVTEGVGSWFGLFGQGEFAVGLASKLANSQAIFAQSATRLRFGGIVRFPVGERSSVFIHGGYGRHGFSTSTVAVNASAARPTAPDVLFEGPRGGVGARIGLGATAEMELIAGGQYVMGLGELGSAAWFPDSSAFAVDAGLGFSFRVVEHVRLRLNGQWQGTFVTLGGGTIRANNASEQYLSGAVTLQWAM